MKDYYKTLGIDKNASQAAIRQAYINCSLKYHPDRATEDQKKEATSMFQEINEAYHNLYDIKSRKSYDENLKTTQDSKIKTIESSENKIKPFRFRVVIIGDLSRSDILKTAIPRDEYFATMGVDFNKIRGPSFELSVFDLAGQERPRPITESYYKSTDALILVLNLDSETKFEASLKMYTDHQNLINTNVQIIVLGISSTDNPKISDRDINAKLGTTPSIYHLRTPCTNEEASELFLNIGTEIYKTQTSTVYLEKSGGQLQPEPEKTILKKGVLGWFSRMTTPSSTISSEKKPPGSTQ